PCHRVDVDTALGEVRCVDDLDAETLAQREEGNLVGDVVVSRREDQVASGEGDGRESTREGFGRAWGERDVLGSATEQVCRRDVEVVDVVGAGVGCLVATEPGFEL